MTKISDWEGGLHKVMEPLLTAEGRERKKLREEIQGTPPFFPGDGGLLHLIDI